MNDFPRPQSVGIALARVAWGFSTTFEPKAILNPDESGAKQSSQKAQILGFGEDEPEAIPYLFQIQIAIVPSAATSSNRYRHRAVGEIAGTTTSFIGFDSDFRCADSDLDWKMLPAARVGFQPLMDTDSH
jgi:hypothetical protein